MTQRLLAPRDVQERSALSRWALYELIHSGRLPAIKIPSGHYRVTSDVVDAIVKVDEKAIQSNRGGRQGGTHNAAQ